MPSYEHKQLVEKIVELDEVPTDPGEFSRWIEAGAHLEFLRNNALADELIIYAGGDYSFIHTLIIPNDRLSPTDRDDLLAWGCTPYTGIASYVSGGGREGVWVERGEYGTGSKSLEGETQLIFGRTFEGWTGEGGTYFEVNQEYTHMTGIHWRPEHRSYCRFDQNGDIEHVVSVTAPEAEGKRRATLVSFQWEPLEYYLAASQSSLVRMFDFTLLKRREFKDWPNKPTQLVEETGTFFYLQKVDPGHAAFTRGVQIIRPRESAQFAIEMKTRRSGSPDEGYIEFIARDWRNKRVRKISTDPAATTSYFAAEGNDLPFELSPAFFRPEVLLKYKQDKDKYTVAEREVSCRATWRLRGFDVNDAGQVHAYICDLRTIPYAEQLHWLSYNEPPKAPISERAVRNDFAGQFLNTAAPLHELLLIVRRWHDDNVLWWQLRSEDLFGRVSTPVASSQDEWSDAFMDLSKLVVEGFDVKYIRRKLDAAQIAYDKEQRSISLLETLSHQTGGISQEKRRFTGLRTIQEIRTKAKGHASGRDARRLAQDALTQHESYGNHFEHVCKQVADELSMIETILS